MPVFDNNGQKYNVKDEHIGSFADEYPDATTEMEEDGRKYRVKAKDYDSFLSEYGGPGAEDNGQETRTERWDRDFGKEYGDLERRRDEPADGDQFRRFSTEQGNLTDEEWDRYQRMTAERERRQELDSLEERSKGKDADWDAFADFNEKNGARLEELRDIERRYRKHPDEYLSAYAGIEEELGGLSREYNRLWNAAVKSEKFTSSLDLQKAEFGDFEKTLDDTRDGILNVNVSYTPTGTGSAVGRTDVSFRDGADREGYSDDARDVLRHIDMAKSFDLDTRLTLDADSDSFFSGMGVVGKDPNTYLANIPEAVRNIRFRKIVDKMVEGGGYDSLTKDERLVVDAWQKNAEAHALLDPTRSSWFKGGQGAAQSIEFMAEMAVTGGIIDAASKGILKAALKKGLVKGGKELAGKTVMEGLADFATKGLSGETKYLAEQGVKFAEGLVKAPLQSALNVPMQLRSYGDALLTFDENGNLPSWGEARKSGLFRTWEEMYTEEGVAPIWNVLTRYPMKWAGVAMNRLLPGAYRSLAEMYTKARVSGVGRMMRAGGFQGLNEEVFEEFMNALIDETAGDRGAVRDFFTKDNFETLYISFAPITMIGGGAGMAQVGMAQRNYENVRKGFGKMLGDMGFDRNQTDLALDGILADPAQGHHGLVESMTRQAAAQGALSEDGEGHWDFTGKWKELADMMAEYRAAAARKAVYDGAWKSEQDAQRRDDYRRLYNDAGADFSYRDEYGGRESRTEDAEGDDEEAAIREGEELGRELGTEERREDGRMTDGEAQRHIDGDRVATVATTDGRRVYVLGRTENGEWAVMPVDGGEVTFIGDDQIVRGQRRGEDGNIEQMSAEETVRANTTSLRDYIDGRLLYNRDQQRKARAAGMKRAVRQERYRMSQEIAKNYQDGTGAWTGEIDGMPLANPQGNLDEGLQVADADGKIVRLYTWDELYARENGGEAMPTEQMVDEEEERIEREENGQMSAEERPSALERIPKDGNGNPVFGPELDPSLAWDAMVEYYGGDSAGALQDAQDMLKQKRGELSKLEKEGKKSPKGSTIAEKRAAREALARQVDAARKEADFWQGVVSEAENRARAEREQTAREGTETGRNSSAEKNAENVGESEEKNIPLQRGNESKYRGWEKRSTKPNTSDYEPTDEFRELQESSLTSNSQSEYWRNEKDLFAERGGEGGRLVADILRRQIDAAGDSAGVADGVLGVEGKPGTQFTIRKNVSGKLFHDIFEIVRGYLPNGELVDLHDGYDDCVCYLSDDGTSGFAIERETGNLVSVFNLGLRKGFLHSISDYIKDEGATHLDAYASKNQNLREIYGKTLGAKVASSMDYNMEYDHDGIAERHGSPDVVFMLIPEKGKDISVEERHFGKDEYDEAEAYANSYNIENGQQAREKSALEEMTGMTYGQIRERWGKNYADLARSLAGQAEAWGLPCRILVSGKEYEDEAKRAGFRMPDRTKSYAFGNFHNGTVYICVQDIFDYARREGISAEGKGLETLAHEGLAHFGLRAKMGTDEFNAYCDRVFRETMTRKQREEAFAHHWDYNMTPERKREYLGLDGNAGVPAWKDLTDKQRKGIINGRDGVSRGIRRGAADEYIASVAEKVQRGDELDGGERNLWERIVDWFRQTFGNALTERDIADELAQVRSIAERGELTGQTEEGTENAFSAEERNGKTLDEDEAKDLLSKMKENATPLPESVNKNNETTLTKEMWDEEFGEGKEIRTPIGNVKFGENQYLKFLETDRAWQFALLRPTLESPDVIVEEPSPEEGAERQSKYLFMRTFKDNEGKNHRIFMSVSVKKDGLEVVISNHFLRENQHLKKLMGGEILWNRFEGDSNSSDENQASDASDTASPSDTTHGSNAQSTPLSEGKGSENSVTSKENGENPQFSAGERESMTTKQIDDEYFRAMEAGDEARMREMLDEVARRNGYGKDNGWRSYHTAPSRGEAAEDGTLYTWTLKDVADGGQVANDISDSYYASADINGSRDESMRAIQDALSAIRNGEDPTVTIYRAVPKGVRESKVRNGDWVTMSRAYAEEHGRSNTDGGYRIIEEQVPASRLYWDGNDINEWGFDDQRDYRYRNTKNNRKLDDLVTRDDDGNVIPPSRRFDSGNDDIRFSAEERTDNATDELERINDKFNKELKTLTEENANSVRLYLGKPSPILRSAGIADKTMLLYGNKVMKKIRKHGFAIDDLRDLPLAVANPIAVFRGSEEGTHAVLTELKVNDMNILVSISVGKNNDVDFNIITSAYGKAGRGVINWILNEKLLYTNKEKTLEYLRISAPIAEAQSIEELDSATKVIQDFDNPTLPDENVNFSAEERELSDADTRETVSDVENPENDGRFSAEERVATADEARERLGVELTPEELASTSTRHGAMMTALRKATEDGAIPGMDSDALLSFLSDTFRDAPEEIKSGIWEVFSESAHPDIAGEVERSLADYVSREVRGVELTDAQREFLGNAARTIAGRLGISGDNAKYVLWQHANAGNDLVTDGERQAMRNALGVGTPASDYEAGVESEARYSAARRANTDSARDYYEKALSSVGGMLDEVYHNEYRALDTLVDAIAAQTGRAAEGWENPKNAFNQLSSRTVAQLNAYMRDFYDPMVRTAAAISRELNIGMDDIVEYMSLKHGLERNRVFQERAEREAGEKGRKAPARRDWSGITAWMRDGGRYGTVEEAEAAARKKVDDYEKTLGDRANELWDAVRRATEESLRIQLRSGLMSRGLYDSISSMFGHYIPLQGFADTTNEDLYPYYGTYYEAGTGTIGKKAEGRTSKAADPFTRIGQNAQKAIVEAEKNRAKLSLYNFILARQDNDLATTGRVWYVRTNDKDADGKDIWEISAPSFSENDTQEEMQRKITEWEDRMRELEKGGDARSEEDRLTLGSDVVFTYPKDVPQHCVDVTVNGRRRRIYVKGNPRAAQAANGLLSGKDGKLSRAIQTGTRYLASIYTSLNPQFFVTNFARDIGYASANIGSKEGAGYGTRFIGNAVLASRIGVLSRRFRNGELDMDNEIERMYHEFAMNGGITGYSQMRDDRWFENHVRDALKGHRWAREALNAPLNAFRQVTEDGENLLRFAAYVTSRQAGRSVAESVADAKDATVNFNRRGTGRMITADEARRLIPGDGLRQRIGRTALMGASLLAACRPLYAFFNVAVQGMAQMIQNVYRHPGRAAATLAGYFGLGLMQAMMHGAASGMFGGDPPESDDWYWNLTDWERRNNIIIPLGGGRYIKIPMAQELRVFYGLGDMIGGMLAHKTAQKNIPLELLGSIGDMLPVNVFGEGGVAQSLAPTLAAPVVDVLLNTDYRGSNIIPERYGGLKPKWEYAYRGTADWAVTASRVLNALPDPIGLLTGRDRFDMNRKSTTWHDVSPEALQHYAEGYLGGILTFAEMTLQTGKSLVTGDDVNMRSVPFVNRFYGRTRDRDTGAYLLEMNRYAGKVHDTVKTELAGDGRDRDRDAIGRLRDTKDFAIYSLYEGYGETIKDLGKTIAETEDERRKMDLIDRRNGILADLATEMEKILYDE